MIALAAANIYSIIVALILIVLVVFAMRSIVRNHKSGNSSCSGNCIGCPMAGKCSDEENSTHLHS